MARNARHAAQLRRAAAARAAAVKRLVEAHGEEFRRLYIEEARKYDIEVAPHTGIEVKSKRVTRIIQKIKESGVLDGIDVPEPPDRYPVPETPIVTAQKLTRSEQLDMRASRAVPRLPTTRPDPHGVPEFPWED